MSDVSKRDSAKKAMLKISAFASKLQGQSIAAVQLHRKTLGDKWASFESYHEEVIGRTGPQEVDMQEAEYDSGYELYHATAALLDTYLSEKSSRANLREVFNENRNKHNLLLGLFTQIKEFATINAGSADKGAIVTHSNQLDILYKQFQDLIISRINHGETDAEVKADQCHIYTIYTSTSAILLSALTRINALDDTQPLITTHPCTHTTGVNTINDIKVTPLIIKKFNGRPECWESFRDSYVHSFHNRTNMPDVIKFQHLKSLLEGEAEELVRNFVLTDANYRAAWKLLSERYQNPKYIINAHMKTLFNQFNCSESADDLRKLLNKITSTLQALQNLDRPVEHWDDWLVYLVSERLDPESRKLWEQSESTNENCSEWATLDKFLQSRIRALESIGQLKPISNRSNSNSTQRKPSSVKAHQSTSTPIVPVKTKAACPDCNRNHPLRFCYTFRRRTPEDRRSIVNRLKLCFNCLGRDHAASNCPSDQRCRQCNDLHHTLLHTFTNTSPTVASCHSNANTIVSNSNVDCNDIILLATAYVDVTAADGSIMKLRAMLDSGSQASFISTSAVQMLRLPKNNVNINVTGLGSVHAGTVKYSATLQLSSSINTRTFTVNALVLPVISKMSQVVNITPSHWKHIRGLRLADPRFHRQDRIDLLLGADIYGQLLMNGLRSGPAGLPIAQNTAFGWVLSGPVCSKSTETAVSSTSLNAFTCTIDQRLQKFWELEEIPVDRTYASDESACEEHFIRTHQRDPDGRFIVRLPFVDNHIDLGDSYIAATVRQRQMERRFSNDRDLQEKYSEFMNQYHLLNHMEPVTNASPPTNVYYIPHHAVFKESSSSTKLRVVFDASQKSSNNKCLNEQLYSGPKLQQDLTTIITRWRKHAVVFSADIEKMFRQVKVHPADQDLQRIVWRSSITDKMQIYRLTTVTYGTSAAPYLAIRCLMQLALDEADKYPVGSKIALSDVYVDDVLSGSHDIISALESQSQIRSLFQAGGFILKKWTSNCEELLSHLPIDYRESSLPLKFEMGENIKMLGIQWNPATDEFSYKVQLPPSIMPPTKRSLLSDVAQLYDPLGWLSPTVVLAKTMFQQLWTHNLNWDDPLPFDLCRQWLAFRDDLVNLQDIKIERWVKSKADDENYQIHGFCDASNVAYAAVVYLRVLRSDGTIYVTLLASKTKVAPIKTISVPRLELCGAMLLAKLINHTVKSLDFPSLTTYAWTDSMVVLGWLGSHPTKWNVFVANRVSEIQRLVPAEHWKHVRSESNPADCASRGVSSAALKCHLLWWRGPEWLLKNPSDWPANPIVPKIDEEERKTVIVNQSFVSLQWQLIQEVSDWQRLLRITAYCIRFCSNLRKPNTIRTVGPLTTAELIEARNLWVRITQQQHYLQEITSLTEGIPINKKSNIISLNPFIDNARILRVGGRLKNSSIPYAQRHPIIVPKSSPLSHLLIRRAHHIHLHGGTQQTLGYIRRTFWLIDGRNEVNRFIQACTKCIRFRAQPQTQIMADLPSCRVTPARAFLHTGVDFSGAIMVRSSRGRGHHASKAYICVFVCMVTRAIHIELVSQLTSAAFIAAFKRFVSRRGICSDLYSDNGTNFVGADAELRKALREATNQHHISNELANQGTTWHFNPPLSPHFNGISESGIRSIKHHLRRIIGESTLTFEEMYTFLTQVEACLNSRPLHAFTNDPADLTVMTPGHFLIQDALTTVPEPNVLDTSINLLSRWQLLQKMYQTFWQRWSAEYLHHLQQRQKWRTATTNIEIGELVIIKDDNLPPSRWALGRVMQTHAGADGKVRVTTIRTQNGLVKRSIVKLVRLPNVQQPTVTT